MADPTELRALAARVEHEGDEAFRAGGGSQDITRLRRTENAVLTRLVDVLLRTKYSYLCHWYSASMAAYVPYLDLDFSDAI